MHAHRSCLYTTSGPATARLPVVVDAIASPLNQGTSRGSGGKHKPSQGASEKKTTSLLRRGILQTIHHPSRLWLLPDPNPPTHN